MYDKGRRPRRQFDDELKAQASAHPKKSRGLLREAPGVGFVWIAEERAECSITQCCQALRVVAHGAASMPGSSVLSQRKRELRASIRASHEGSRQAYGSPTGARGPDRARRSGQREQVARLMQAEGLRPACRKRFRSTTLSDHDQPIAGNLLDRQFSAERPINAESGTAEFHRQRRQLYLAAIMDLHSRFIVGGRSGL
jgi:putative transposase